MSLLKGELIFSGALTYVCCLIGNGLFIKEYFIASCQLPILLNLTVRAQDAQNRLTVTRVRMLTFSTIMIALVIAFFLDRSILILT